MQNADQTQLELNRNTTPLNASSLHSPHSLLFPPYYNDIQENTILETRLTECGM